MIRIHPTLLAFLLTCVALTGAHAASDAEEGAPSKLNHVSLNGPTHFPQTDGEALYHAVCQSCHMPNGQGGAGAAAFPALTRNSKLEAAGYPIIMVVNGNKAMPSFKGMMSDAQIAAVVTYVRSHFGNSYSDAATVEEVKLVRDAGK